MKNSTTVVMFLICISITSWSLGCCNTATTTTTDSSGTAGPGGSVGGTGGAGAGGVRTGTTVVPSASASSSVVDAGSTDAASPSTVPSN